MLKIRKKRVAARANLALDRLNAIETAITALDNEDLLDFADIFANGDPTPLHEMAAAEMLRRNLSL